MIDDDVEICTLLSEFLYTSEGFVCECAHSGDEGLHMLEKGAYDLVILDVMLPGRDGFDILREIRSRSAIPVIMLSARGDHIDRVVGLEIGADDYIYKPFNSREMSARVRAVLRRASGDKETYREPEPEEDPDIIRVDDLVMNTRARTVTVKGEGVPLTNLQFRILRVLLMSPGKTVPLTKISREALMREYRPEDRNISVHISKLRQKLGSYPSGHERIVSIRREGFVYVYEN